MTLPVPPRAVLEQVLESFPKDTTAFCLSAPAESRELVLSRMLGLGASSVTAIGSAVREPGPETLPATGHVLLLPLDDAASSPAAPDEIAALAALPLDSRVAVLAQEPTDQAVELTSMIEQGWRFRGTQDLGAGWSLRVGVRGSYPVRRYREGDQDAILELFRASFHDPRDTAHWLWKYRDQPYGQHRISLVHGQDRQLVAQYCAYPVRFDLDPTTGAVIAHQVGDTMTSPAVRAQGRGPSSILATVAEHFYRSFCRGRVAFNYGFNTGNIQRFSTRFVGAHKIEDAHFRRLDRALLGPAPRRWRRARASEATGFGEEYDRLYARCRPHYGALIERCSTYLTWRFARRPDIRYRTFELRRRGRLTAWSVFARRGRTLVWGDALFERASASAARDLLAAAVAAFEAEAGPLEEIVGWFPARPAWWHQELERLGFVSEPEPQGLGLVVVPFSGAELVERLRRDIYYTYGDSDLF